VKNFIKIIIPVFIIALCCLTNSLFSFAKENFNASVTKDSINSYPDSLIMDETPPSVLPSDIETQIPVLSNEKEINSNNDIYKAEKQEIKIKSPSNSQIYNITLGGKKEKPENTNIADIKKTILIGDYSKSEDSMDRLITQKYLSALDLAEMASFYETLHKHHKAFFAYERALEKQPNRIEILYNYSLALYKAGYYNKARYNLNKIIRIRPDFMLAHYQLANIYYDKGDYKNALQHYAASARINPMSSDTLYNIGSTLEAMNYDQLASKYYIKCLNINPFDSQAAEALMKLKNV